MGSFVLEVGKDNGEEKMVIGEMEITNLEIENLVVIAMVIIVTIAMVTKILEIETTNLVIAKGAIAMVATGVARISITRTITTKESLVTLFQVTIASSCPGIFPLNPQTSSTESAFKQKKRAQ